MSRKIIIIVTMVMLLVLLVSNFNNHLAKKKREENAMVNFNCYIECIPRSIEQVSSAEEYRVCDLVFLGMCITKAKVYYTETSYYRDNPGLYEALEKLENAIGNNSNIDKVLEEKRLQILTPVLKEIYKDPRNCDLNQKLIDLVNENCYIAD